MSRTAAAFITVALVVLSLSACVPDANRSDAAAPGTSSPTSTSTSTSGASIPLSGAHSLQTITGVGVNANVHSWKEGQLKPAIDMYTALGPLVWRVIIDRADWETTPVPGGADQIDMAAYSKIYSTGKMADLWNTIRYISSSPGQSVILNVMGGVPDWMGGSSILPDKEDYWVRTMASMVAYGRNVEKLHFTLLAPMNEIDWNGIEGPKVDPHQYTRLMHKLLARLDSVGLNDVRLVVPDTASPQNGVLIYLPVIAADSFVAGRIAAWGLHTYIGDLADAPGRLSAAGLSMPTIVTEFSGPCPGCDDGTPNPNDYSTARSTGRQAVALLGQGAAGLQFYDAWDGYYEHHGHTGYWGGLANDPATGTYLPRHSFGVIAVLAKCVVPGAVRVEASVSGPGAESAQAFLDPRTGRISVLVVATDDGGDATIDLSGAKWSATLDSVWNGPSDVVGPPTRPGSSATLSQGQVRASLAGSSTTCLSGHV